MPAGPVRCRCNNDAADSVRWDVVAGADAYASSSPTPSSVRIGVTPTLADDARPVRMLPIVAQVSLTMRAVSLR